MVRVLGSEDLKVSSSRLCWYLPFVCFLRLEISSTQNCPSPPRCIPGFFKKTCRDNPVMNHHSTQEGVVIFLVALS